MKTQNPFLTPLYDLGLVQIESEVEMLDSSEKVSDWEPRKRKHSALDSNEDSKSSSSSSSNGSVINETRCEMKKTCADCGTNKTPLWRGGPAGPKSLCNACGIRSRKKRRAMIAATTAGGGSEDKKPLKGSSGGNQNRNSKIGDSLKQRLMELGREVMIQRSTVKYRWKLEEEEQAAIILMALSYG